MVFLLIWDKNSYTGRFLVLFPCIDVLQPQVVHLYQSTSLSLSPLPIVALANLRLLYSFLYSEHISHMQVLGFLPLPYPYSAQPSLSVTLRCALRLRWCSPVLSIYLQMTKFHSSLWLCKILLWINTTFS
jgi:hypothetical protein